jgi:hypothetical protein
MQAIKYFWFTGTSTKQKNYVHKQSYNLDDWDFDPQQRQRIFTYSLCVQTSSEAHPASFPWIWGDTLLSRG